MGDGTQPVTMRVFADQAGTLTLGLEAGGQIFPVTATVEAGWNNVVFDVSSAANYGSTRPMTH